MIEPPRAGRADLQLMAEVMGVRTRPWWPSWYIRRRIKFEIGVD
jgi:hypothetical protein